MSTSVVVRWTGRWVRFSCGNSAGKLFKFCLRLRWRVDMLNSFVYGFQNAGSTSMWYQWFIPFKLFKCASFVEKRRLNRGLLICWRASDDVIRWLSSDDIWWQSVIRSDIRHRTSDDIRHQMIVIRRRKLTDMRRELNWTSKLKRQKFQTSGMVHKRYVMWRLNWRTAIWWRWMRSGGHVEGLPSVKAPYLIFWRNYIDSTIVLLLNILIIFSMFICLWRQWKCNHGN